jgi:hypothetical protein
MSIARLLGLHFLLLPLAGVLSHAGEPARYAHDLYVCANLSGQGQVMGGRVAVPSGIYRSSDRQTFEHIGPNHIRIFSLACDPQEPATLFVAALDGVLRTPDLGKSWRITTGWDVTEPKAIACDPGRAGHVYAGLPDGIIVSHDHGQTWQRKQQGIRRGYTQTLVVDRSRPGRVLAGTEKGIFLSEDGADTWRLVQATDQTVYDLRQSPHAPEKFFAVTSIDGAFWSEDGGRSWRRIAGVPSEHTLHNCDFDVHNPHRLVVCGWGAGVLVSEDEGKTWQDRTAGLPKREVWRVAVDPDIPNRLYAAPYLEALHVSDDFGRTWRPLQFEKVIAFDIVFMPRKSP